MSIYERFVFVRTQPLQQSWKNGGQLWLAGLGDDRDFFFSAQIFCGSLVKIGHVIKIPGFLPPREFSSRSLRFPFQPIPPLLFSLFQPHPPPLHASEQSPPPLPP